MIIDSFEQFFSIWIDRQGFSIFLKEKKMQVIVNSITVNHMFSGRLLDMQMFPQPLQAFVAQKILEDCNVEWEKKTHQIMHLQNNKWSFMHCKMIITAWLIFIEALLSGSYFNAMSTFLISFLRGLLVLVSLWLQITIPNIRLIKS